MASSKNFHALGCQGLNLPVQSGTINQGRSNADFFARGRRQEQSATGNLQIDESGNPAVQWFPPLMMTHRRLWHRIISLIADIR